MEIQRVLPLEAVAEWLFKRCITILRRSKIRLVKVIRADNDRRCTLYGYVEDYDTSKPSIFLSATRKPALPLGQVLLHEALHALFPKLPELLINSFEHLLWNAFSEKQRDRITKFVPKRVSNNEPSS